MLKIRHIDHLVLRVTDVKVMLDFYVGILGCTLERVQDELGLYQVRAGNSLIDFVPVDGQLGRLGGAAPGKKGRNLDHFCLRIESLDAEGVVRYLVSKGIEAGAVESRYGAEGDGPSIYVNDPEGNVVELKGEPWESPHR
jgi:catechol 2,3-dioxygenase-like lactoylglutathione lyase family enzyme